MHLARKRFYHIAVETPTGLVLLVRGVAKRRGQVANRVPDIVLIAAVRQACGQVRREPQLRVHILDEHNALLHGGLNQVNTSGHWLQFLIEFERHLWHGVRNLRVAT